MSVWNKNKTAILLILSSLSLLLLFLSSWIHGVYTHEKKALEKEINYSLKDVIGSIEDSLIQKVFLQNITVEYQEESSGPVSVKKKLAIRMDTLKFDHHSKILDRTENTSDTSIHMFVETFSDTSTFLQNPKSILPILMNWESDSLHTRVNYHEDLDKTVNLIKKQFAERIQGSDLPKQYTLTTLSHDEVADAITARFLAMPGEDQTHAFVFSNYNWYLLNKMKHQFLICLILFGAISLSFYMIYSNWRKQQKLIDIKNDFISNVTHELKTPISTVSVALEALSRFDVTKDKEKTSEYLAISKLELNRLRILVDKVLKMSIFEKGATQLSLEEFDMNVLLNEVLSSMKIQFDKAEARVNSQFDGEDFSIKADKIHMTNVLYNLLDNALKYSPETPEIDIFLKESNGTIQLSVKDKGLGIAKADQAHIFDRFYRVPTGDMHNIKGHGLGLSYVATIIDQHKGSISLESEVNQGSTFKISLKKHVEN